MIKSNKITVSIADSDQILLVGMFQITMRNNKTFFFFF